MSASGDHLPIVALTFPFGLYARLVGTMAAGRLRTQT